MTDEQLTLTRRAVACNRFRWMPGMLAFDVPWVGCARLLRTKMMEQVTFNGTSIDDAEYWFFDGGVCRAEAACKWLPDLSDPATLGCLLALVREAWGSPTADCTWCGDVAWLVWGDGSHDWGGGFRGDTEAEALVSALEAAP